MNSTSSKGMVCPRMGRCRATSKCPFKVSYRKEAIALGGLVVPRGCRCPGLKEQAKTGLCFVREAYS